MVSVVTSQAIGVQVQFSSLGLKQVHARVNRRAALDKAGADRADKNPNPGLICSIGSLDQAQLIPDD